MPQPEDELKELLDYDGVPRILDSDVKFIESVAEQVRQGRKISQNQAPIIRRIWDKHFGNR